MALAFLNACIWTAASSGTGNFVVSAASAGYFTPAQCSNPAVVDGATYRYFARQGSDHEEGYGVYTASGTTLTRATVLSSSNAGSKVSFASAPTVFMGGPLAQDQLIVIDNYLTGLTLSTAGSSATMSIAAGIASDSTNVCLMRLAAFSKTTSAWALGSGNGGLDTGAIANNTWYHFWLIQRSDTGVCDVLISTSASSPTMPSNYDRKRRIGSGKTNGSAQWISFSQAGDTFRWAAFPLDVNLSSFGTAAVSTTLTVPTGVVVEPIIGVTVDTSSGTEQVIISSLTDTNVAASGNNQQVSVNASSAQTATMVHGVLTDTNAQVRVRCSNGTSSQTLRIYTYGWRDRRGRDG